MLYETNVIYLVYAAETQGNCLVCALDKIKSIEKLESSRTAAVTGSAEQALRVKNLPG